MVDVLSLMMSFTPFLKNCKSYVHSWQQSCCTAPSGFSPTRTWFFKGHKLRLKMFACKETLQILTKLTSLFLNYVFNVLILWWMSHSKSQYFISKNVFLTLFWIHEFPSVFRTWTPCPVFRGFVPAPSFLIQTAAHHQVWQEPGRRNTWFNNCVLE